MTTYYAVATGNWSSTSTWSTTSGGSAGAGPPGVNDVATLNSASGAITVTIDGTSGTPTKCTSLICTGFTGTLAWAASASVLDIGSSTAGALTLVSGMTVTTNGASIYFVSTVTGNTITTGGHAFTFQQCQWSGAGGGWTLQDSFTGYNNGSFSLNGAGATLNTNGQTFSTFNSFNVQSSANLTLGSTVWSGITNYIIINTTGTVSAASSTITTPALNCGTNGYTFGTVT